MAVGITDISAFVCSATLFKSQQDERLWYSGTNGPGMLLRFPFRYFLGGYRYSRHPQSRPGPGGKNNSTFARGQGLLGVFVDANSHRLDTGCTDVWSTWKITAYDNQFDDLGYREIFNQTATELRQQGWPLMAESYAFSDGLGSTTLRHLVTWMFAEEMGCDWIKPRLLEKQKSDDGTDLYCHSTVAKLNHEIRVGPLSDYPSDTPCLVTNWPVYFCYLEHGVNMAKMDQTKVTPVRWTRQQRGSPYIG